MEVQTPLMRAIERQRDLCASPSIPAVDANALVSGTGLNARCFLLSCFPAFSLSGGWTKVGPESRCLFSAFTRNTPHPQQPADPTPSPPHPGLCAPLVVVRHRLVYA